jgi:hypothetical protein
MAGVAFASGLPPNRQLADDDYAPLGSLIWQESAAVTGAHSALPWYGVWATERSVHRSAT